MQQYFEAKRRLFEMLPAGAPAIVNADDPRGLELSRTQPRTLTYAIDRLADVQAGALRSSLDGLVFEAKTPRGPITIRSPLVGRPNVYNLLAVIATAVALDLPTASIENGLAALGRVPGRFQVVSEPADDVRVVVDYAHTDDALKNLLETARPLARGRLITVFGCGGDRDRTKRPLMGMAAAELSDFVVLTSDNPRSEDPLSIMNDAMVGLRRFDTRHVAEPDRGKAIQLAIQEAQPGDVVLLAGKGHETYQVLKDRTIHFDDRETAREVLRSFGYRGNKSE
jgi:UDP-N-acetylmuramoyl-L-alanyl-D-glutamate--2,6-diaminopimelate ligase